MAGMNKMIMGGYLGDDAELRFTQGGEPVANFRIGMTERWTGKDGQKREHTEWMGCVLWGKRAEAVAKYLVKGTFVMLTGKLRTRKWEDRDQNTRYTTEVIVGEDLQWIRKGADDDASEPHSNGRDSEQPSDTRAAGRFDPNTNPLGDDDIPF